ncbi:TetR/AcrR family transcriptional regulator [Undibacterium sp. SXout7W]|uniref:TetR/AcrR family transcriptional regulator n=1 Tax=Undibacterium sp. SXout7W TaxID=3413049 RepID=UPI003BF3FDE3
MSVDILCLTRYHVNTEFQGRWCMKDMDVGVTPLSSKVYRGRSADERIGERRKRLVEVGIELYGARGFRATSVKTVCLEAGLTERYFYESFANGEALLCATCTVIMDDMRQRAVEAMEQVGDSVSERVRVAAHTYFSGLLEYPAAGRITLFEMEGVSAAVDAYYAQEMAKSTQLFVEWFLSRVKQNSHSTVKAYVLAQGMLGALYQMAKEWMRSDFKLPVEVMTHHMQLVAVGICASFSEELNL